MKELFASLKTKEFWASLNGFLVVAGLIVLLWLANYAVMPFLFPAQNGGTSNAGTAGDMFGGLTALFSGLAFAGLITTLFMQRQELTYQREELRQTREVFQIQRFENTFFGLIGLLGKQVDVINHNVTTYGSNGSRTTTNTGRAAIEMWAKKLPTFVEIEYDQDLYGGQIEKSRTPIDVSKVVAKYEDKFSNVLELDFGPYFRLIYNVLRHIEYAKLSDCETENEELKLVYSKILRSHLNSSEVKLLMYNCASVHGVGLKPWIEKHSMLKHITREDYEECMPMVELYDPLAFRFGERKTN